MTYSVGALIGIVAILGNNEKDRKELVSLREGLRTAMETFESLQSILQLRKDKLDLFRTLSANERKGFL